MKQLGMAMVSLLFFVNVYATSQQIPADNKITKINTYSATDVVFIFVTPGFNSTITGCTGDHTRVVLYPSASYSANVYSAALAAAASNNPKVGFGINGCYVNGSSSYPVLYRIDVEY